MTTIVLAEDHEVVRDGFRALLEADDDFCVVGEAGDGLSAVDVVRECRPDVLLVDLTMPGLNGLEVIRRVRKRTPETGIVVLSMHDSVAYVTQALRHGAAGYVLKDAGAVELKKAVRRVASGGRYLAPPLSEEAVERYSRAALQSSDGDVPHAALTNREREVFQLSTEGLTSREVGERLSISPRTVEKHRSNLMRKLGLRSQTELVRYAVDRGLLSHPSRQ